MKKLSLLAVVFLSAVVLTVSALAGDTHLGKAVEEASQAGSHASKSAGHSVVASGQITSAASAVPLAIGGSAGAVSTQMAEDLMEAATAPPIGTPLEISDKAVTAGPPPNEILEPKNPQ